MGLKRNKSIHFVLAFLNEVEECRSLFEIEIENAVEYYPSFHRCILMDVVNTLLTLLQSVFVCDIKPCLFGW